MVDWRDKSLFKRPKWFKPELDKPWYYVHIVILVVVILFVLNFVFGHNMMTLDWVWKLSLAAIIADFVAHTVMQRD
jgi:hypothetical protein